jgi:hypothetical protein
MYPTFEKYSPIWRFCQAVRKKIEFREQIFNLTTFLGAAIQHGALYETKCGG